MLLLLFILNYNLNLRIGLQRFIYYSIYFLINKYVLQNIENILILCEVFDAYSKAVLTNIYGLSCDTECYCGKLPHY